MPMLLFVAFILVPIVELAVIIQVGEVIGAGWTVLVLVADSLLGALLVKREGSRAWSRFREALRVGRWPGDEVVQGAMVLIGGALLLTPGFVTDVLGLALVLPPTRALGARLIRRRLRISALGTYPGRDPTDAERGGTPPEVEIVSIERDDPIEGSGGDDRMGD